MIAKAVLTTLLMAMLVFVIVIFASPSPVSAWEVSITTEACAAPGDTLTVPVMAYNITSAVPDIAAASYNIKFNASVVNVMDVATGSGTALPVTDWNFIAHDTVRILAMDTDTGHTGDVNLANVTFEAVGSAGSSSSLRITDAQFTNYTGKLIAPDAISNGIFTILTPIPFDTGRGTYPSIFGTHNGTITPGHDVFVSKMYTYPCPGTGGHSEYVKIWKNESRTLAEGNWTGYRGDWHTISFDKPFILKANESYNYTLKTGSYPLIHHTDRLVIDEGVITCISFKDVNGKIYNNWIPAIRLE